MPICIRVIGLSIRYMEDTLMAEATIPFAQFKPYHGDHSDAFLNTQTNMVLDSGTLESLEIFHNQPEEELIRYRDHK